MTSHDDIRAALKAWDEELGEPDARMVILLTKPSQQALYINAAGWLDGLLAEVERLQRWKDEAQTVMGGLQGLGTALGLRIGERVTGEAALKAVEDLNARLLDATARAEAAEQAVQRVRDLADELRARHYLAPSATVYAILRALDGGDPAW